MGPARSAVAMQRIVIWGGMNFNWLWVPLAAKCKAERLSAIHFIGTNAHSVRYWKSQDPHSVIDSFTTVGHFFHAYDRPIGAFEEIGAAARAAEQRYGVLVADILQADRHLGRGFSAAGIGHPRSLLSAKAEYAKSMRACVEAFAFWEEYFDRVRPDLILGFVSGIVGKACTAVAQRRGIPVRALTHAAYEEYFYWSEDEYYSNPAIATQFADPTCVPTPEDVAAIEQLKRVPWTHRNYEETRRQKSLGNVARLAFRQAGMHAAKRMHGNVTGGNYVLRENLRFFWQRYRDLHAFDGMVLTAPRDLVGKRYVFFPLHMEPETALAMKSPEFNEQLAVIEFLAKNLPAGVLLVVKEHFAAIGRRPKDFYRIIAEIPNVVMVPPDCYAADLVRGAKAAAVITSTLGAEAAMLGIPVLSFGLHNAYNFLDHVHVITSWMELRPLLARLCGDDPPGDRERRVRDGVRFLRALKCTAFDLSWCDYAAKVRAPATGRELQVLYATLCRSVERASLSLRV